MVLADIEFETDLSVEDEHAVKRCLFLLLFFFLFTLLIALSLIAGRILSGSGIGLRLGLLCGFVLGVTVSDLVLPFLVFLLLFLGHLTCENHQLDEGGSVELGTAFGLLLFLGIFGLDIQNGHYRKGFVEIGLVVHSLHEVHEFVNRVVLRE